MTIPRVLEGFDIAAAVARMLDDEGLWWQSFGMFIEHYVAWPIEWEATRGNLADERKKVHSLRSAAANIGAVRLASAAAALEDALVVGPHFSAPVTEGLRLALREAFRRTWGVAEAAWREDQVERG